MADKKNKAEDNRDVFDRALEEPAGTLGPIVGAILGARALGGRFGKASRTFERPNLNVGARMLGVGAGALPGLIIGTTIDQKAGLGKYAKKKRK